MKTFFLLILILTLNLSSRAQQTFVPDNNFEHFLETHDANMDSVPVGSPNSLGNGIDNDNFVLTSKIDTLKFLKVNGKNISDLTGIEDFTALKFFNCSDNQITQLDLSNNPDLLVLYCYNNLLSFLNVSQNPQLAYLICNDNQLTSLDVSMNPSLTKLDCNNNQLTQLDVSQNTSLIRLNCSSNLLTSIDLSQNQNLQELLITNNQLTRLDLSNNPNVLTLDISHNQISDLIFTPGRFFEVFIASNNQLTRIDFSNNKNNTALSVFSVANNLLTYLDLRNMPILSIPNPHFNTTGNPDLTCIYVDDADGCSQFFANIDTASTFVETEAECIALAIEEQTNNRFNLYPNLVSKKLYITGVVEGDFIIYSPSGKVLKKQHLNVGNNVINLSKVPKGLYIAEIRSKNLVYYEKIIKK